MMRSSVLPAALLRRGMFAGVAVTTTLVLAACGGSSSGAEGGTAGVTTAPSSAPAGTFNDTDVTFAQSMIAHHRQAVDMADLAASRAASSRVKDLAAKIEAAQQPEIDMMTGWLTAWGKPAPAPGAKADTGMASPMASNMPGMGSSTAPGMPGMGSSTAPGMPGMGSGSAPGMMRDSDMARLMATKGVPFDRMFLSMMISHHTGAVQMAQQESAQGTNPDATALAKKIITDQQAQITQMKGMLTGQ